MLMHAVVMIKQNDINKRIHYLSLYEIMKTNVQVISYTQKGGNPLSVSFTYSNSGLLVSLLYPSTAYDGPKNHGLE
jgi:hypothetical protein